VETEKIEASNAAYAEKVERAKEKLTAGKHSLTVNVPKSFRAVKEHGNLHFIYKKVKLECIFNIFYFWLAP
jgi:hypothetical protein